MYYREWYFYYFLELVKIILDNYLYVKVVKLIGNRKVFIEEFMEQLEELVMDSGKVQVILDASRSFMGQYFMYSLLIKISQNVGSIFKSF